MVNLIQNENMKIYRRIRTWVMVGLLVLIVAAGSLIIWKETGRGLSDNWQSNIEQQIAHNNQALKGPNTPPEMIEMLKKDAAMLQYRLDNNIPPLNATMWGPIIDLAGLVFLITLFVVVVAGDSLAGEFSTGTIKLLLIRPASRTKIMLSKYISAILFALFLLVVLFLSSVLIGGSFYGFAGFDQPFLKMADGSVLEKSMVLHLWSTYFLNAVSTVMFVTMAFMISAVFRSSAMAIGISIFSMFAGSIITQFLSRYEWSKYILFANIDLTSYLYDRPFMEGMTLGFSIAVLLVYFAIFNLLAWLVFTRRDVAA